MLLFNHKKEFIGIDEEDLRALGFTTFAQLLAEAEDFADMFVKKPGYIHNFKHVNWIDFVECADSEENAKVIIHANTRNYQCFMSVKTLFLSAEPTSKAYMISLNRIKELSDTETKYAAVDLLEQSAPEPIAKPVRQEQKSTSTLSSPTINLDPIDPIEIESETFKTDAPLDLDEFKIDLDDSFDAPQEVAVEAVEAAEKKVQHTSVTQEVFDNGYLYDPNIASGELGLPVELIEEFIEDFIAQAKEFKSDLYNALDDGDNDKLKIQSHKLKGVAANLRIEDALECLTIINTSTNHESIKTELDTFYNIIAKLSGETIEVVTPITQPTYDEPQIKEPEPLELDGLDLDFTSEPELELKEENSEIKDDIEDFTLEFKDETDLDIQEEKNLEITNEVEDFELEFKDEFTPELAIEEVPLDIDDKDVPQDIILPELADDDYTPHIEETTSVNSYNELTNAINEDTSPELEDEVFNTPTISYSKENVAGEIGLDQASFNELFEEYLQEAKNISYSISTAIETQNVATWKHLALKLKGMSDNMRVQDFTKELETLINTNEVSGARQANAQIVQYIDQLSNTKD